MSESTSIVWIFVGLLLSAAGAHTSCPIELSPPSVVVRYGDPVLINCSTSRTQFEGIGWEASEGAQKPQKVNHLTWTLDRVTDWSISPLCFFNPVEDDHTTEQCSIDPKIVVYTFPETISVSSDGGFEGILKENEEYNFTCDIPNIAPVQNLTVSWYKGEELIFRQTFDDPIKKPVSPSSLLTFNVTRQDSGVAFRCEAHLDLGQEELQLNVSSQPYNITVRYGPEVTCSATEFLEGDTLEKKCPVTGNPTPLVMWRKDGLPVDPTLPLTRENAGHYTIEAEGSTFIKKELQVLVLYGPELTCPNNYSALENSPNSLTCTVKGYPKPEIIWYKDGDEVELPENLTRSDAGQYMITASNKLSSVNLSVDITVLYPPSQIVELEDTEADAGSSVWLKCSSMGNPRPQYSWDYYHTDNVRDETEDGVSRLLIHNSTAYNMGSYTCHAWNDIGNVSKTARVTVKGAKQECPVVITPDRMVIQYQGRSLNATCRPISNNPRNIIKIHWQDRRGQQTSTIWSADTETDWDPRPVCNAVIKGSRECQKHLDFTLYKTPDSVSILTVGNRSSVVEEREFQLQCDITNVAPAKNLSVRWYRGNETIESLKGTMQVSGCLPEDTNCDIGAIRSPVNVSSTISVTLNRTYSGAELRCEAWLDLGPEGPQPPPNMISGPLSIIVYYKPTINTTNLAKTVPVFSGYPEELVCRADGYPPPKIEWIYSSDKVPRVSGDNLTVSEAGIYNCTATNEVDSMSYEVEVILKEDYLPLIAGFVAVTVIAISIIFIFIYSIYYKNTKMRRYSLKNPKLNTHNGNVAHNGWDSQLPMTKLS